MFDSLEQGFILQKPPLPDCSLSTELFEKRRHVGFGKINAPTRNLEIPQRLKGFGVGDSFSEAVQTLRATGVTTESQRATWNEFGELWMSYVPQDLENTVRLLEFHFSSSIDLLRLPDISSRSAGRVPFLDFHKLPLLSLPHDRFHLFGFDILV